MRPTRGTLLPIVLDGDRASFGYDGLDGVRRTTTVVAAGAALEPVADAEAWPGVSVLAIWRLSLEPGARQTIGWHVRSRGDDPSVTAGGAAASPMTHSRTTTPAGEHPFDAPRIQSDHELLDRTLIRSMADLATLRNDGPAEGESYVAAGIPWFATLFGRDSLIAALETVAFIPSLAVATLEVLARLQATRDDPWHDAEPGKILHEMRAGEMARAGETPHDAYYGSVDATPLWLILLAETHAWTGDDALLDRLWPNALAALAWIEDSGDLDGDGFVEYQRRSTLGLLNQGWKDSGDAIRHLDGRPADGPIALAEVQGYVFAAHRSMARLARHRGDTDLAGRLDARRRDAPGPLRGGILAPGCAVLRDGPRRREATRGEHHLEPGPGAVGRDHLARTRLDRRRAAARPGHVLRLGHPDVRRRAGGLQPGRLPHGLDLAARQRAHRGRAQGDGRGRRREPAGGPADRIRPVVPGPAAARAVLRVRARGRRGAGRLSGRLLAAGVVGGRAVLPAPHDARTARQRVGQAPRAASGRRFPEWLGKLTITGLPVGDDSVDLLVHRWRGRTSAELLGRRGTIEVVIHV